MGDRNMKFNAAFVEEVIHRTLAEKESWGPLFRLRGKGKWSTTARMASPIENRTYACKKMRCSGMLL